ncbi:MAG: RimK family alpha-L-glutamate ligase [Hyphomicrobiaceae bacterium]
MKIALFVDEGNGDWHSRRLVAAFRARGVQVVVTSLKHCAFDTASPLGLRIPGFDGVLPDGVFVRSISHGSLEQITFRLGILHALRESGVRVWNDARAIERCVDKSTATFLFQRAGLPVPPTLTVEGESAARLAFVGRTAPVVVKPLFGAQGVGLTLAKTIGDLPNGADVGDVYYMQSFIPPNGADYHEDWRVFVSGGQVISAMSRRSKTWITNVAQGALPTPHEPDAAMAELALAAARALGADYAGVDLIRQGDGGLLVLEVNSNPAWRGLQSVTQLDIAERLVADFLAAVEGTGTTCPR